MTCPCDLVGFGFWPGVTVGLLLGVPLAILGLSFVAWLREVIER